MTKRERETTTTTLNRSHDTPICKPHYWFSYIIILLQKLTNIHAYRLRIQYCIWLFIGLLYELLRLRHLIYIFHHGWPRLFLYAPSLSRDTAYFNANNYIASNKFTEYIYNSHWFIIGRLTYTWSLIPLLENCQVHYPCNYIYCIDC